MCVAIIDQGRLSSGKQCQVQVHLRHIVATGKRPIRLQKVPCVNNMA